MAQGRARTARPKRGGSDSGSSEQAAAGRASLPAARRRAAGSAGTRQTGRRGIPWPGLALLLVIGAGVVLARTMGASGGEQARPAEPTLASVRQATSSAHPPAAAAAPSKPTTVAVAPTAGSPSAAAAPTATRAQATSAPTRPPTPDATSSRARASSSAGTATQSALVRPTQATSPALTATASPTLAPPGTTASAGGVALTFDAGADRGYAEDILDTLQSEHVQAGFGITGAWARANPDLVRRMASDGHMLINHTLDHRSFTGVSDQRGGLSAARRRAELDDADAIIAPLLGHSTQPWYRLPYGDDDAQVAADVRLAGYTHKVGWTVDSYGWRGLQPADIVARCLSLAAAGGVYVLHVGHASQDALALPQIIHGLRDKGFSFVRVDQA